MNERFFFRYAKEIKDIFTKYGVQHVKVQRGDVYTRLYLDFIEDPKASPNRIIHLENDMRDLANAKHEVTYISYSEYEFADKFLIPEVPFDYNIFLQEGLVEMACMSRVDEVSQLLSVGIDANYQSLKNGYTSLHGSLSSLAKKLRFFHLDDSDAGEAALKRIADLKKIILTLINHSNIDLSIKNAQGFTPIQAAINALPENKVTIVGLEPQSQAAQKEIGKIFQLLQDKGITVDAAEIIKKGYPIIAEVLNKPEQAVSEKPMLTTTSTAKSIAQHGLYSSSSTAISAGSNEADIELSSIRFQQAAAKLERLLNLVKEARHDTSNPRFAEELMKAIDQIAKLFPEDKIDSRSAPAT